ncbi:MAG: hypothetical protein K9L17_01030 [Clostridiales bacterium]|nr:hypothetical protein [Clostridiales bacterium]MCF8021276.1 hypothetical protein [Clostridiales bacterium]
MAIKKIAAALLLIVFVIGGWIYLAGMGVERTVINSPYYHGLINEVNVVKHLHEGFQSNMKQTILEQIPSEQFEYAEDKGKGFSEIIVNSLGEAYHVEWMEKQVLKVVNDILAVVKGNQENLTAVINLETGKERFKNELSNRLENANYDGKEPVPEVIKSDAYKITEEIDIPDQINLAELTAGSSMSETIITKIQTYRSYFQYLPYMFFALVLGLICLLIGISKGLKWFGSAALISGLTFLIILYTAQFALRSLVINFNNIPLNSEVLLSTTEYTISQVYIVPIIYSAVGVIIFIAGMFFKKKHTSEN